MGFYRSRDRLMRLAIATGKESWSVMWWYSLQRGVRRTPELRDRLASFSEGWRQGLACLDGGQT